MAPALIALRDKGWQLLVYADDDNSSATVFDRMGIARLDVDSTTSITAVLKCERPDVVLVGISTIDDGSEKAAIRDAKEFGNPVAVIIESWPQGWIKAFGERDLPLYRQADKLLVVDSIARNFMMSLGFRDDQVVVTGNPAYDYYPVIQKKVWQYRSDVYRRAKLTEAVKLIFWAITDTVDETEAGSDHIRQIALSEYRAVEDFLKALQSANKGRQRAFGVFVQKPTYGTKVLEGLIEKLAPGLATVDKHRYPEGLPQIVAADLLLGTETLVVQEAALLGVPAAYYRPGKLDVDHIANQIGITFQLNSQAELADIVDRASRLGKGSLTLCLADKLRPYQLVKDATANVVSALESLVV